VGWDGHLSDSGECPKNIKTIWDSHCTIGHLLAMLDMTGVGVSSVGVGGGGWVHPKGANSMAVLGLV